MKKLFFILISLAILTSCKKDDEKKEVLPDNIDVTAINESIGVNESLEFNLACSNLSFFISSYSDKQVYHSGIELTGTEICDACAKVLVDANGNLKVFDKNQVISGNNLWASVPSDGLTLNQFAGKGEKYIGICAHSFSSGEPENRFGWMRIELSGTASVLKLKDYAINRTEGNSILAGQTE